jgi:hypothetical protein
MMGFFLFATASRPALEPTQILIQWVPRPLNAGVKRLEREADQSPLSSDKVKNAWSYTCTHPTRLYCVIYVLMTWCFTGKNLPFNFLHQINPSGERNFEKIRKHLHVQMEPFVDTLVN